MSDEKKNEVLEELKEFVGNVVAGTEAGIPPTEQQLQGSLQWHYLALVYGYNELARKAETLGSKVYCRIARDDAEKTLIENGYAMKLNRKEPVLTLRHSLPYINFTEDDIALMRKFLEEQDKEKP